jgi:hypothetical protein
MSPASYLAAPPRVARANCSTLVTIRSMPSWAVDGAAVLAVFAAISALAYAVAQSLLAWRAFKRFRRHASRELDRVTSLADVASEKAARADAAQLEESLAALRISLARFAVLRKAADEVTETVDRVAAFYPRK